MKPSFTSCRIALAAAALGCATTLIGFLPSSSVAGNDAPPPDQQPFASDASEIGDLAITSELKSAANGRWVFELCARNTSTDRVAQTKLQAVVQEQVFSEASRSAPVPEVAWHAEETVSVAPGETVTRTWTIPAQLAFRIGRSLAAQKRAEAGQFVPASRAYSATVREAMADAPSEGAVQAKRARAAIDRQPIEASPPASAARAKVAAAPNTAVARTFVKSKPAPSKLSWAPPVDFGF